MKYRYYIDGIQADVIESSSSHDQTRWRINPRRATFFLLDGVFIRRMHAHISSHLFSSDASRDNRSNPHPHGPPPPEPGNAVDITRPHRGRTAPRSDLDAEESNAERPANKRRLSFHFQEVGWSERPMRKLCRANSSRKNLTTTLAPPVGRSRN